MNFPTEFRRIRKQKKLTQQQAADLLEVSSRAVKAWEGGEYLPKHETLILEKLRIEEVKDYKGRLVSEVYKLNGVESLYLSDDSWILKLRSGGETIEKTVTFEAAMDWLEQNGKYDALFSYANENNVEKSEATAR